MASAQGQKMSKTKGNVIDPLVTIAQYGADALRYTLVTGASPGQDVPLSNESVQASRNFANKLWNAGRYLVGNLQGLPEAELAALAVTAPMTAAELSQLPLPERHIVSKCHQLVAKVTAGLESYDMGDTGRLIYEFLWDEYADWYIEASKVRMGDRSSDEAKMARRVLVYVFDTCLRLLHPFMPFVTEHLSLETTFSSAVKAEHTCPILAEGFGEVLWQQLPHSGDALMVAPWPQQSDTAPLPVDTTATARFQALQALVRSIRNARAEYKVEPARKIAASVQVADAGLRDELTTEIAALALLARLDPAGLTVGALTGAGDDAARAVHCVVQHYAAHSQLGARDDTASRWFGSVYSTTNTTLTAIAPTTADKIRKDMEGLSNRLNSSGFADKAPPAVVEATKAQLADMQEKLATVVASMESMQ
eukprot:14459-Heterococcus_DN1.PRE.3